MKILIFSMGPIFKSQVEGGSQKILVQIAKYLGYKGHEVTIICTKRSDNNKEFELEKNVVVKPILPFKECYPEPYYTAPYNLATAAEIIKKEMEENDVFYIHDCEMNIFLLNEGKPVVSSARDYVYPDTLLGAFNFQRDKLIVNSEITRNSIINTIGRYMPQIRERIKFIPNGIDTELFKKRKPDKILDYVKGIKSKNLILFPNRPDEKKGIMDCLKLISRIKKYHGLEDLQLLIPLHINLEINEGKKSNYGDIYYNSLKEEAKKLDISENILLHPWIPLKLMPEYYSLGKITLSIGSFIESFGSNSSVESICCGTVPIVSKVGAQRTTIPDKLIPKIDPGDIDEAEKICVKILKKGFNLEKAVNFVKKEYDFGKMLREYEKVITQAKILDKIKPDFKKVNLKEMRFSLPPWCFISQKFGFYNDYEYKYIEIDKKLLDLIKERKMFSLDEAKKKGLNEKTISLEISRGNLIMTER